MSCEYTKLKLNQTLLNALEKRFIAFDTETTGLDAYWNRIIEVGAVLFENGEPVKQYGSLIHSVDYVPYDAQAVNHITNAMVRSAPSVEEVYPALLDFFGDAVGGDTIIVGHNATFDMKFLAAELWRFGASADILYADTCAMSRRAFPELWSHTQDSVARRLDVYNQQAHRAVSDAETCGKIMVKLIPILQEDVKVREEAEKREKKKAAYVPEESDREICCSLLESVSETDELSFRKQGKLVHAKGRGPLFSWNFSGRNPYLVLEQKWLEQLNAEDLVVKKASGTELKLYENAYRLIGTPEVLREYAKILIRMTMEEDRKRSLSASEHWNMIRDHELFWRP